MKTTSINIKDDNLWRAFRVECIGLEVHAGEVLEMLIKEWLKKPTVKPLRPTR